MGNINGTEVREKFVGAASSRDVGADPGAQGDMEKINDKFLEIARKIKEGIDSEVSPKAFRYQFLAEPLSIITENLLRVVAEVFDFPKAVLFLIEGDVLYLENKVGEFSPEREEFLESYRTWTTNKENLMVSFLINSSGPAFLSVNQVSGWLDEKEKELMNVAGLGLVPIRRFQEPVGVLIIIQEEKPEADITPRLRAIHALTELIADNLFFSLRMQARRTEEQWRAVISDLVGNIESAAEKGRVAPFVLDSLIRLDKVDAAAFFSRRGDEVLLQEHRNLPPEFIKSFHCKVGEEYIGGVFQNAEFRYRGGAHKGVFFPDDTFFPPTTSFIHQPIIVEDRVEAAITIISRGKILLTSSEIMILKSMATHLSMALRYSEMSKSISKKLGAEPLVPNPGKPGLDPEKIALELDMIAQGEFGALPEAAKKALEDLSQWIKKNR